MGYTVAMNIVKKHSDHGSILQISPLPTQEQPTPATPHPVGAHAPP